MSGFRFDGIEPHIAAVESLARRMDEVVAAAQPLDPGAYGVVGLLFSGVARATADTAAESVHRLGLVAAGTAAGLRATSDAYLAAERAAAAGLDAAWPDGTGR